MAGSVNKVILVGNLGADPEIRVLENGSKLARLAVATSESYIDKQSGERRELTEWHNVTVWRKMADVAENFLKKGMKIYVEGKIRTRSWQDENGQTRYATDINGDYFTMLSPKQGGGQPMSNEPSQPYTQEPKKPDSQVSEDLLDDNDDDDLPF